MRWLSTDTHLPEEGLEVLIAWRKKTRLGWRSNEKYWKFYSAGSVQAIPAEDVKWWQPVPVTPDG